MVMYKCGQCKKRDNFDAQNIGIRCKYCGNKYFYKERPTIAKTIKAE